MNITLKYTKLPNRNYVLHEVYDPSVDAHVDIEMKDLTYNELIILQGAQKPGANVVDETYKIFAGIIVAWNGEPKTFTTLELKNKGFAMYRTLEMALQEFFLTTITFVLDS